MARPGPGKRQGLVGVVHGSVCPVFLGPRLRAFWASLKSAGVERVDAAWRGSSRFANYYAYKPNKSIM